MSLFDIAPSQQTVEVNGTDVPVPGISLEALVALLGRFPALQAMLGGGDKAAPVSPGDLLTSIPEAAHAAIAAGLGHPGDKKAEDHVAKLAFGHQLKLFEAVVEASLPEGVDPTVARLNRVTAALSGKPAASRAKK